MRTLFLLLSFALVLFTGCAAYNAGYYEGQVEHRYLLVDEESKSLGFKYLGYTEGFRAPIKGFVRENGRPDFIYVYQDGKRKGIILYYVAKNQACDFIEANWKPDSVYPRAIRPLTAQEKAIYEDLLQKTGKAPSPGRPSGNEA